MRFKILGTDIISEHGIKLGEVILDDIASEKPYTAIVAERMAFAKTPKAAAKKALGESFEEAA